MRRHALLTVLGVLGAEANHEGHLEQTTPGAKTLNPMVALYDCRNASSSSADCGPAVRLRLRVFRRCVGFLLRGTSDGALCL